MATYGIEVYSAGTSEFKTAIDNLNSQNNSASISNSTEKSSFNENYTVNYLYIGKNIVEYNNRIWFNFKGSIKLNSIVKLIQVNKPFSTFHSTSKFVEWDGVQQQVVVATSVQIDGIYGNWAVLASYPSYAELTKVNRDVFLVQPSFTTQQEPGYVPGQNMGIWKGSGYTKHFSIAGYYDASGSYRRSVNYLSSGLYKVGVYHLYDYGYTDPRNIGRPLSTLAGNSLQSNWNGSDSGRNIGAPLHSVTTTGNTFYFSDTNNSIGPLDQYDFHSASTDGQYLYSLGASSGLRFWSNYGSGFDGGNTDTVRDYQLYYNIPIVFSAQIAGNVYANTTYYIYDSEQVSVMTYPNGVGRTPYISFSCVRYRISATGGGTTAPGPPIVLTGSFRTNTTRTTSIQVWGYYQYGGEYRYLPIHTIDRSTVVPSKLDFSNLFVFTLHTQLWGAELQSGNVNLVQQPVENEYHPGAGVLATSKREPILQAFMNNGSANLIPTEAEISYWKARDLGVANSFFNTEITSYNQANYSQYNSNVAIRTAWANIQCPFTESQIADLNGSPSQAIITGYTMLLLNSNDTNNKIQDSSSYQAILSYSGPALTPQTDLTYLGTMQLGNNRYYTATSNNNVITSVPLTYNFTIEFMIKPALIDTVVVINAPNYYIYYYGGYIYFVAGGITVQIGQVNLSQWNHVAIVGIPINGEQYIQGYTNGIRRISSNAITTRPSLAFGAMQFGGPTLGWGSQFSGYLAQVRIVWGHSVYNNTSSFTVSTSKPLLSRAGAVFNFTELPNSPIIKENLNYFLVNSTSVIPSSTIEYWMQRGTQDKNLTIVYDTTKVTWNLVDRFTIPAGHTIITSYPQFSTREFQVTQLVVGNYINTGTSGLNTAPLINTIRKDNNFTFEFSGSNVVTSIIVFVR